MKQLMLLFLLCPLLSAAQYQSRFEHDTLYTSCGYKIYKGQTLQFGKATGTMGRFRYVNIKNGVAVSLLENNSVVVKELSNYGVSRYSYLNIDVTGSITYKDGSTGGIVISLVFERAIGSQLPGTTNELIVPEEFRGKAAAVNLPAFEQDTLTTSCGYKIYKGQLLQFGKATGPLGRFRYVNIKNGVHHSALQNHQVRVKELKDFGISALGNGYITIRGNLLINNKDQGIIVMHIAFDYVIENIPGVPSELVVPGEFRNRAIEDPEAEVLRLEDLYRDGGLTKEEFEALKKKLLKQ